MSSRGRNFRRRAGDTDDDDTNEKPNGTTTTTTLSTSSTKSQSKPSSTATTITKPKKTTPKNLLSFVDDEDTETPITRPPSKTPSASSSRFTKPSGAKPKLTALKDRLTPSSTTLPSNVQPQAGTYTKEALLELQKNTKTLVPSRPAPEKQPSEPRIVLKGLLKPVASENIKTLKESVSEEEDDEVVEKRGSSFRSEKEDATTRLGSVGLAKGRDLSSGSSIPDQATIDAIRAKRERLRQSRAAAPDYIALDSGSNHGEAEGLSDEEPEFRGRIGFLGEKIDSGKRGVFEDANVDGGFRKEGEVGNGAEDSEDEEDKIWEEEQFRKGLGKRMDDGANRVVNTSVALAQNVQQQKFAYPSVAAAYSLVPSATAAAGPSIGGSFGTLPVVDVVPVSQQAELSKKAFYENMRRLKDSHDRTIASLTRTEENLSTSLLNVTALEGSLTAAGEKFIFMQKLRDFVSVICEFLQDKLPYIEELEEQMQNLHKQRAAATLQRRLSDNNDEMMELESSVNAAMSVFSKRGDSAAMIEAATIAAQAATTAMKEIKNLPVELDEFGRDMNLRKRMDITRRAEARQRRRARSDAKRMQSVKTGSSYQQIEGESSTDESDSESAAYQSTRDQLLLTARQIFSDASEEYSQLSAVMERFERWKRDFASSYRDAYMSESVYYIFSPYVRLELLKWDPLHEDADFIDMKWHSLLFTYGLSEDESRNNADDADTNIIPELVERVAIPILRKKIDECWDILSTRETKYAVAATSLIFRYVPLSSKALGELVAALCDRIAEAISNLMVPTWNTLVMKAVPNAARVAAYRFGMSARLLRNICLWNKILAMPVLEKLALDDLLSGKILPHLRSIQPNIHDAVTRAERIVASLSGVWAGSSVTGERSAKLQPLVDYLLILGKTLEKNGSGFMLTESTALARRLKKMLVELNEYDLAKVLSKAFNLKEAL